MTQQQYLIKKFNNKTAVIGILGLGYVGLTLMLRYAEAGYKVLGFDVDSDKTKAINGGNSYIEHIPSESIQASVESGLEATIDFSRIAEADALILCVPTPLRQ